MKERAMWKEESTESKMWFRRTNPRPKNTGNSLRSSEREISRGSKRKEQGSKKSDKKGTRKKHRIILTDLEHYLRFQKPHNVTCNKS